MKRPPLKAAGKNSLLEPQSAFRPLPAAALAVAAILLALLVIWATRPGEEPKAGAVSSPQPPRETQPLSSAADSAPRLVTKRAQPTPAATGMSWEDQLDAILTSDESNREAVGRLLRDFNRLPPEAQTEYIAHALNLCEDGDFGLLTNIYLYGGASEDVRRQIFEDALNRGDEIKLPLMARTMATPNHPLQGEAKEMLCLYLELDPAAVDRIDWRERVRSYLRDNSAGQ